MTQTTTEEEPIDFEHELQAALERVNDPESHVERDAETFHPSQIAACERQAYLSKLGLKDHTDILGIFQTGTLIHEFIEEHVGVTVDALFEHDIELETEGVRFVGTTDCWDPDAGAIYDFKTRNGWYRFDPPKERHLDQIHIYMAATGATHGQLVYVSRSDLEVRTWPVNGFFEFDAERFDRLVDRAGRIRDAVDAHGIAATPEEIPFDRCGCYLCDNESLRLD